MSNEELLRPRYKVIAPWPGMHVEPFQLHQVVTLQPHKEEDAEGFIYIPNKYMPKSFMWQSFFDLFPHLFKKLEWWEEREIDEMPEYLKWRDTGVVCKPSMYRDNYFFLSDDASFAYSFAYVDIATATEYEQYINQKEKQ